MTQTKLTVTLPDGTWIKDISSAVPDARFRVLAAMPGDRKGFGLVRVSGGGLGEVLERMSNHDALTSVELLQGSESQVLVQFETTRPLLLFSAQESGVPIELPIDIKDGVATIEVTASPDRLSILSNQLDAFGLEFEVESVKPRVDREQLLTSRQQELIQEATSRGYYDTPRECSMTELAEGVGIAKSTCSETLHRAEGKIIKEFVSELDDQPTAEPSGRTAQDS
ncbi:helix-turn-helix domain-containing protein [Natranaeroarchaeum sulfidigenes]|uniref:Transcriptional regulator, contains HTH domain n=1 Tax=Natranaeroarchaeum sulfidigenes TaxID=2784880 RepID=A0A897MPV2_9EURY|nr:helix-turn-helix domain-containing protein [Natranaeroarchaeum sulfidigenes]QSG02452.1 Transcriptional regulator, contains HTH domain [Natranaeroarchaeum sulfidigenes]